MKRIVEATMQRAILMIVCVVIILAWGGISAFQMQRDYMPGVNNTTLALSMRVPGLQAAQVKQQVTDNLASAVKTVDGLSNVETTSYDGGLFMSLYFPMNTDMKQAEDQVNKALAKASLPSNITSTPSVTRLTNSSFPILTYSVTSSKLDETTLRSTATQEIVKQIKSVPGVADVSVFGGAKDGYVLNIRMKDLVKNGLTLDDVNKQFSMSLPTMPQGDIVNNQLSIPVSFDGIQLTQQQMENTTIKNKEGKAIPISAFATISHSLNDLKTVSRTNGTPSVQLNVIKTPSANITDVANQVKDRVAHLQLDTVNPKDVSFHVLLDRENELNSSLLGLVREGLLGCLFSMICVFFFFRNVRSTLLIAISLPISLLATTAILKTMGITLNILTVSGLIVAMGRIVDDSIVILDNMYRKREESKEKSLLSLLTSAVSEMIPAILGSTLTTIAVYIPIAFVGGVVSATYSGFAWSVVIAIIISFFVAMLVIPALAFMGWKGGSGNLTKQTVKVDSLMKPVLQSAFKHKKAMVIGSILVFLCAGIYSAFLPVNLLPSSKIGQIAIKAELPQGSTLPEVDSEVQKIEKTLKANPKVDAYSSNFGSNMTPQSDDVFDQGGGYIQYPNVANLSVVLKNDKDTDSVVKQLQDQLPKLSDNVTYTVTSQNISGDDSKIRILFTGSDQATLDTVAQQARTNLSNIANLSVDGKVDLTNGLPKYKITFDQKAIQDKGVKVSDVLTVINRYMSQSKDASITIDHKSLPVDEYLDQIASGTNSPITVNASPSDVIASLAAETFTGNNGEQVRLDQIAKISKDSSSSTISERDGQPFSLVTAQITSNDVSKVADQVDKTLSNMKMPNGVTYSMGGISEQVKQMIFEMSVAVAFSILLVLMITSSIFKGWRAPLAVLLSIPLALSGVVIALVLFGGQWNLAALIGVLMLTGIVVTNGIVLIDKIERNRKEGMPVKEAVLNGSLSRIRPILMTAAATILTLLSLAFSHNADTVVSQTLGIVVIGGMVTSTINSFIIIPIIYEWLHKKSATKNTSTDARSAS
ncbi:efflux RND transporter permease subunit [Neobacillus massiliamazoniensis]|uniref:AcrB/AcrD/AcrF family transporter n=1 Tax=Neobacillus massiliamazoniensis TaxID=1499688 RepID=A0A0U1P491_9BACI|nr:efflux RND transporter permease subunit [Neobacillus massiliamazoniensis]CRK85184.1 AcrB/AcrD/AcrF family transporter [Neobacillus massiliamazoniensis]